MQCVIPGQLSSLQIHHNNLMSITSNPRPPVLVVGMHNSGTSLLANILHENGVFMGNNMSHCESHFFSIFANDLLIMGGKGNWARVPIMSIENVMAYRNTVGAFIKKHWMADYLQWGYDGSSLWGIKDPRLCVLLPLYLDIFPGATVIYIHRNPEDVAASLCQKTKQGVGKRKNFKKWQRLCLEYTGRVDACKERCTRYKEVQYEQLCTRPIPTVYDLLNFLNLRFTKKTEKLLSNVSPARIGSYERWKGRRWFTWASKGQSRKLRGK